MTHQSKDSNKKITLLLTYDPKVLKKKEVQRNPKQDKQLPTKHVAKGETNPDYKGQQVAVE